MLLPIYDLLAKSGQPYYTDALKEEIERFKQEIDYDSICQEVNDDMKRLGLIS